MDDARPTRPEDGSEPVRAADEATERPADGGPDASADRTTDASADRTTEGSMDGATEAEAGASGRDPRRFNEWRKRSATGAVMTGIALGLKEALELPRQRPALVIEAPGEPDDPDHPIDLHFDPDDPTRTVAVVRHREDRKVRNREDGEDREGGGVEGPAGRP
ncbi:MAG TPA: hypothetical protein VG032_01725 [Acidimicrobiales bacterium]|nr:hypothetical protein [Acidimicrobiales bacterium]